MRLDEQVSWRRIGYVLASLHAHYVCANKSSNKGPVLVDPGLDGPNSYSPDLLFKRSPLHETRGYPRSE